MLFVWFFLTVDPTEQNIKLVPPTSSSFFCSSSSSTPFYILFGLFGLWMKMSVRATAPLTGTVPARWKHAALRLDNCEVQRSEEAHTSCSGFTK